MWKRIETVPDLKKLCTDYPNGVGVTKNGDLYVYDFQKKVAKKISIDDASKLLEVSLDVMSEIVRTGGTYQLPTPVVEIEPKVEIIEQPEEPIEEKVFSEEKKLDIIVEPSQPEDESVESFKEEDLDCIEDLNIIQEKVIELAQLVEKAKNKLSK
jgi:hypothetical protein